MTTVWRKYRRVNIAEMTPWEPGMDLLGVSISAADSMAGSPRIGDMIARNPADHTDKWLVCRAYFVANFVAAT